MQKLNLNFFGEKAEINIPTSLESLKKSISEKFFFSPSEVADLAMFYMKDLSKKIISTEEDLRQFLKEKFNEINLDINENGQLFKQKESELVLQEKLKELQSTMKAKKEDYSKKAKKVHAEKEAIKAKLEIIKAQFLKKKEEEEKLKKSFANETKDINEEIKNIKKALGIKDEEKPAPKKEEKKKPSPAKKEEKKKPSPAKKDAKKETKKPKTAAAAKKVVSLKKCESAPKLDPIHDYEANVKRVQQEMGPQNKPIHEHVQCDGCGCYPIVGVRYKCAVCKDFDFCEQCEDMNVNAHQHPFIKIADPKMRPTVIKCVVNDKMPIYQQNP